MKKKIHLLFILTLLLTSTQGFSQISSEDGVIEIAESDVEIDFDYQIKDVVFPVTIDLTAKFIALEEVESGMHWKWEMNGKVIGEGEAITAYPVTRDCVVKLMLFNKDNELVTEITKDITVKTL